MKKKLSQDLKRFMAKRLYNYWLKCTLSTNRSHFVVVLVETVVVVVVVVLVVVKLNSLHRAIVFRPKARCCVLCINCICCLHEKRFFAYFPFLPVSTSELFNRISQLFYEHCALWFRPNHLTTVWHDWLGNMANAPSCELWFIVIFCVHCTVCFIGIYMKMV